MPYSSLFKCKRINTYLLQDSQILNDLIKEGYHYIRKFNYVQFHEIVRYPTMGCVVELCTINRVGCVRINSKEGQKLINKKCYF
jgi:hypothetical protein